MSNNIEKNLNPKIILIDDSEEQLLSFKNNLHSKSFEINSFLDPYKALECYKNNKHAIIISDISLQKLSGIDLLLNAKKINQNAIVILSTTSKDITKILNAIKVGVFDYLIKPINFNDLINSLKRAVQKNLENHEFRIQQKHMEEDLKTINENLELHKKALEIQQLRTISIIENAHVGFLVLDYQTHEIFICNKKCKELLKLNLEKDSYLFKRYDEILSTNTSSVIKNVIQKVSDNKNVIHYGEHNITDELIIDIIAYPVIMNDQFNAFVIVLEDITDKKVLEKQILQTSRLAVMGQLSAVITHEINNPISFILSNSNSLLKYYKRLEPFYNLFIDIKNFLSNTNIDEENILDVYQDILSLNNVFQEKEKKMQEFIDNYNLPKLMNNSKILINDNIKGIERIKNFVAELKEFSYMGHDKLIKSDIHKILESTLNLINHELKFKAEIIKEFHKVPLLDCFPQQLSQVFSNILINASHAINDKGKIFIKTFSENNCLFIEIKDTGTGMNEKTLKNIFNPFFTTKEAGKGTGLGMSIAHKIIEKHNGSIEVKSELNKGTTFKIKLPINKTIKES